MHRLLALLSLASLILLGVALLPGANSLGQSDDPAVATPDSATAVQGTAFTYQGSLEDSGSPAGGSYDFRFILYDAPVGGSQVGEIVDAGAIGVERGLFTAQLDFGNVFDGLALWLEIGLRPGAGNEAYTILAPRQPLTAAPYALGLRPGALINSTEAQQTALTLQSGGDGLLIKEAADDGIHIQTARSDGVMVDNAGSNGLRVGTTEQDGISVQHAGNDGIFICSTGDRTTCNTAAQNNDGVDIGNVEDFGIHIDKAGRDGVRVNEASGNGLSVESAGQSGVHVIETGSDALKVVASGKNGLDVFYANEYGAYTNVSGKAGMRVENPGTNGLYVFTAGDSGVWVRAATNYAGYFAGNVHIGGSCSGCTLAAFGINQGKVELHPGDIVSSLGVSASAAANAGPLLQLQMATQGQPIVGVVAGRAEFHTSLEDGMEVLVPRDGEVAAPGDMVSVIIYGPVETPATAVMDLGARVTVGESGDLRALRQVVVEGVQLAEAAPSLGVTLEAGDADGNGRIWVLVNPQ